MNIEIQINRFLEKKKTAWSETTLKSNTAFLRNYGTIVKEGNPSSFLKLLQTQQKNAYTIQTYFIHAGNFYEFLYPTKENVFRVYRKENRNAFKNAYQTKKVSTDYDTARQTLEAQEDSPERQACLYLLKTAQRSSEAGLQRSNFSADGSQASSYRLRSETIIGKGGKERLNLGVDLRQADGTTYYRVYRYLKRILGISPHALRKLALTRAGRRGARPEDLCEIAGWSDIRTAIRYLQPERAEVLSRYLD